ncbi:MAG: hypothetical protein H6718_02430 [Polyangiaceae bacterium]|nr:hypothetical protein [Polyangiaceae bacterium]MCB9608616.1 hypothetical protein [Polyangiaceae bacterium]
MPDSFWPPILVVFVTRTAPADSAAYRAFLNLLGVQITRCAPAFLEIIAWIEGLNPQHLVFEVDEVDEACLEIVKELRRCNLQLPVALIVPEVCPQERSSAIAAGVDQVVALGSIHNFLEEKFGQERSR